MGAATSVVRYAVQTGALIAALAALTAPPQSGADSASCAAKRGLGSVGTVAFSPDESATLRSATYDPAEVEPAGCPDRHIQLPDVGPPTTLPNIMTRLQAQTNVQTAPPKVGTPAQPPEPRIRRAPDRIRAKPIPPRRPKEDHPRVPAPPERFLDVRHTSRVDDSAQTLTIIVFFVLLGGWFYGKRIASRWRWGKGADVADVSALA